MAHRINNYSAFYVSEPISETNLGTYSAKDFVYYNMLRAWKGKDCSFPFLDAHDTTYNVRDNSDWELTLKPRLHQRLRNSKNIILFLSENTHNSRALREEIDYGINVLGLPVIVVYPDYNYNTSIVDGNGLKDNVKALWNKLPCLGESSTKNSVYVKYGDSPSASDFQSLPRAISCRFCNFSARTDSRRRLQHEMNAPNAIFPRKRRKYNIR